MSSGLDQLGLVEIIRRWEGICARIELAATDLDVERVTALVEERDRLLEELQRRPEARDLDPDIKERVLQRELDMEQLLLGIRDAARGDLQEATSKSRVVRAYVQQDRQTGGS